MKIIIIFGPPGVGKGTQAGMLAKKIGYEYLSTGNFLRNEIAKGTELGNQMAKIINAGHLAPDDLMLKIIDSYLAEKKEVAGVIFDGFPRTLLQAELFQPLLKKRSISDIRIINLIAKNDELIKRLLNRAKLEGRVDDSPEIIKNRLDVYNKQTEPVLEFYKKTYKIFDVDGTGAVEKIHEDVMQSLKSIML